MYMTVIKLRGWLISWFNCTIVLIYIFSYWSEIGYFYLPSTLRNQIQDIFKNDPTLFFLDLYMYVSLNKEE